jgi:beta-galactosidase
MAKLSCIASAKSISSIIAVIFLMLFTSFSQAQTTDGAATVGVVPPPPRVTTVKDVDGWKLQFNYEDLYIKGVVWGHSPKNQNYTYNLWGESDQFIKAVLDHDFGLMAKAGVTANRAFTIIPPKWVTYIYQQHGIMSLINPLMGRYGASIDGVWRPFTDYSDKLTRETLKAESMAIVEQFKDVPGVLMFAFGNESNYGLSWSSFEIENLPKGEQNREKAKYLYSLFGEVISEGKKIAPDHLFSVVNGDIQYLDLIAEYVQNMDVLGVNVYRGIGFTDLWRDVAADFDRPILFMEFGSDAFNAKNFAEDEPAQANFLRGQWQEMYSQSHGNGGVGNSVGGFVFEWRDEWWKYKQTENLDVQDRNASWSNGGYSFDFVEGQNNMNEEWFGITRIGELNSQGFYESEPRMAYDVLSEIWKIDPYASNVTVINQRVQDVDMDLYALKGDIRLLKSAQKEASIFTLEGGSFSGDFIVNGRDSDISVNGEDGLVFSDGQMVFLDFGFEPSNRIKGDFSLNILGNVSQSDFDFRYGDRGGPIKFVVDPNFPRDPAKQSDGVLNSRDRVEIYDFNAIYEGDDYDVEAFYHVPRYHWGNEGDFFGLLRETTDMEGQDIWNSKAPYGVEYAGKNSTEGLKIVFGPEVYWGANPLVMAKYEFDVGSTQMAFMHSEDIARRDDSASSTEALIRQSRQTTLYGKRSFGGGELELGALIASTEKVGDKYDRMDGTNIIVDEIEDRDTLGFKLKYVRNLFGSSRAYIGLNVAGLVADSGNPLKEQGTELPYSALGNKREIDGGIQINTGHYSFYPRFLVRENLVNANPNIDPVTTGTTLSQGIGVRNRDDDPFAVLDNREAQSAEFIFTYDPTPETPFYEWNADQIEDAPFAYNIGLTATSYNTATDAELVFNEEFGVNAPFGGGLRAEDVYLLRSKLFFNPRVGLNYIVNLRAGKQQSTGETGKAAVDFFGIQGKVIVDRKHIYSAHVKIDDFGAYDFQRQFNITFPLQLELEYTLLLDQLRDEKLSSKFGVKALYRELDAGSGGFDPENPDFPVSGGGVFENGANQHMFEVRTYYKYSF